MLRPDGAKLSVSGELTTVGGGHGPRDGDVLFGRQRDRSILRAREAEHHAGDLVLKIGRQNPGAIHGQLEKLCHEDHRWAIASLRVARQRRLTKPHTDGTSRAPSNVLTTVPTMKGSTPPVQAASAPMR